MNHRRGTYIPASSLIIKIQASSVQLRTHSVSGLLEDRKSEHDLSYDLSPRHRLKSLEHKFDHRLNELTESVDSDVSFDRTTSDNGTDVLTDDDLSSESDDPLMRDEIPLTKKHANSTQTKYPHAILRYFNNSVLKYPQQVLMSGYRLDGAHLALAKLIASKTIKTSMYVVNIAYELDSTGKKKNKTGDTQLFMTGTIETGETPLATTIFELREEVKMKPIKRGCVKLLHEQHASKNQTIYWYGCDVKHLRPAVNTVKRKDTFPKRKDKVVCILYGTLDDVMKFLKSVPLHIEKNDENIDGLVCMKMTDVIKIEHIIRNAIEYSNPYSKFYWKNNGEHKIAFVGSYFPVGLSGTI